MVAAVIGFAVSSAVEAVATEVIVGSILEAGIIGGIAETVGASVLASGIGTIAGGLASTAVRSAFGSATGATQTSAPQAVAQAAEIARGLLLNTAGTIDPLNVIYGSRKVGGTLVYAQASGASNEYLHLVLALCEGEISSVPCVYLDGTPTTDAKFAGGYAVATAYTGSDAQAASAALMANCVNWTSAHTLSGVAYVYLQLVYDPNIFSGIPTITCDVRGKLVYDPRDSTTQFSNNPALCIRDYLTNTRYGRGIPTTAIDEASFIAAANACDVTVSTPDGTQATYTCDGVVNTDAPPLSNLSDLLTSCRGFVVFAGGKYKLLIDQAGIAGFAFTEDNIVGQWSIKLPEKRNRANRVRATFFDPDNNWQPNIAVQESTTYRSEDNGVLLECEFSLPYTANIYRAQQIAQQVLKQSRKQTLCQFTATIAGLRCEVGDLVTITHSTPGWSAKIFRVMRLALLSSDEVEVTAIEYDAAVYNLDALVLVSPLPGTSLPDMSAVAAPTSLTLASGAAQLLKQADGTIVSRLLATWPAATNAFVTGGEVQMKRSSGSDWQTVAWPGPTDTAAYLNPVLDGAAYDARIRFLNSLGVVSTWATVTGHVVIGKTEPPANVTGFTATAQADRVVLAWDGVADLDLSGYELRQGTSWATGVVLGNPRTTLLKLLPLAAGTYTWWIKAVDTTGNYSTTEATATLTITGPTVIAPTAVIPAENLILSWPAPSSQFQVADYEIRYGNTFASAVSLGKVTALTFSVAAQWAGMRRWWVCATDIAGNLGTEGSVDVTITAPTVTGFTQQVIDNTVLLYWTGVKGTLPIDTYEFRKGSTWAGASLIGTKTGAFTTIFETVSGVYVYWVAAIDVAGNYGTPVSLAATVSQPPDYVLKANYDSTFSGTKVNMFAENGTYLVPVNTTETYAAHFTGHSWATPQDQINAGDPIYIQPNLSPGSYAETIDYGTLLASNRITITLNSQAVSGTVTPACTISVSPDNATWTDYVGTWQTYATSFRYVKVAISFMAAGATDLMTISGLNIRLDSKLKTITKTLTCAAADAGGTIMYLTDDGTSGGIRLFIDVDAIQVTPLGTTPVIAVYDFTDTPHPLSLKVLLFNTAGTRLSGTASVTVRGF